MEEVWEENSSEKSCLSVMWRLCNALMSAFFALASYVQINDPDAELWMVAYGVPAALCACLTFNPQVSETLTWRRVSDLHMGISCAVAVALAWRVDKERPTEILHQEEGREFSGLVLMVIWLLMCRHSGRAPVGKLRVSVAAAITAFPFVAWLYYHINDELRSEWPTHCKDAL